MITTHSIFRQWLGNLLTNQLPENGRQWLQTRVDFTTITGILTAFVAAPRFTGKHPISLDSGQRQELSTFVPGFSLLAWPLDRVTRTYLLLYIPGEPKETYLKAIETLFDTAEMNELVALYVSLPVLAYPEHWVPRSTDAVRSNMGVVFDALALGNPYPAQYFSELAWNQLVMKTIFNDKSVNRIMGLQQRVNPALARIFIDFAHERWAAGRHVPPESWQLIVPFVNEQIIPDLQRLFASGRPEDRAAATLVCQETPYLPAHVLGQQFPVEGTFSWKNLEIQMA
ncbi:MAG: EboA domain-containing protein [Siphonobacter sp.]